LTPDTYREIENQLGAIQAKNLNIALISTIRLAVDFRAHPYSDDFLFGTMVTKKSRAGIWILNRPDEALWRELTRAAARMGASYFVFLGRVIPMKRDELKQAWVVQDHINVSGKNPLIGPNDADFGTRFPDMTNLYDNALRALAMECTKNFGKTCGTAVCLVLQSNLRLTALEDGILSLRDDLIVSNDVYAGAITAKHLGGSSAGLIFSDGVPINMINGCVAELVDKISQV